MFSPGGDPPASILFESELRMEILIPAERIRQRVSELAAAIRSHYGAQPLTIVGILTGSIIFLADLIRHLDMPVRVALVRASSYRDSTLSPGELRVDVDQLPDLSGRHVLLIDDILDTGRTISRLVDDIRRHKPDSLRVAVLLRKHGRQEIPLEPNWVGFDIPNLFVVGYGLDCNDEHRHLPYLAVLPPGNRD
jgi:hypoxanthine phosphoribosyltransferase